MTTDQLFYVEVSKGGWVLARDEAEAREFRHLILGCESVSVAEVTPYNSVVLLASGWNADCYVYHRDHPVKDIKLGEVM